MPVHRHRAARAARLGFAWLAVLLALGVPRAALGQLEVPDRRKEQFQTEPAYLVIPFPYSLPGIGSGVAFTGLMANIAETQVDAYGLFIIGDVEGDAIGVEDLYLIPNTLFLEFEQFRASKALINNYETRGMDSDEDEYNLLELSEVNFRSVDVTLTFFERRLDLYYGVQFGTIETTRIRDSDGNVIADLRDDPYTQDTETRYLGAVVDLTDDRQDARKGIRLGIERSHSPRQSREDPQFNVWDYTVSVYVPVGTLSTLLLHYFRSETEIEDEGETDVNAIREDLGFDCAGGDGECAKAETELVERILAERESGTASALGGEERLRSYPNGRFQGAYTVFYGAEFRWNLTEEVTPFDYFIWKDVRTGVQLAFFYETGSVSDQRDELGDTYRSSYGAGVRLISASGFVYRADYASGEEGSEFVVIFSYPY